MKNFFLLIFFFAACFCSIAQTVPPITEQQLENLTESTEAPVQDDQYLTNLQYYRQRPLSINKATASELQQFSFLTDLQIQKLLQYRGVAGAFVSLYELQAVPTWDVATIRKILPFITISDPVNLGNEAGKRFRDGEHTVLLRLARTLEESRGYNDTLSNRYLGSPDQLLARYRYQHRDNLLYGITAQKDAGEQFFKGAQRSGFDFYSAHFFARNLGIVKALAVGDYRVNLGQGLIQWGSLAFGKSADVLLVKRQAPVLLPYSGAGEALFNRGAGVTVGAGKIEVTAFGSLQNVSANRTLDTLTNEEAFTSLIQSGLARTAGEIRDRNAIRQTGFGGSVAVQTSNLKIAVNGVQYLFSAPFQPRTQPYNRFGIRGDRWTNYSIDYSFTYRNAHFFGEAAIDGEGGKAVTAGALLSVDPKADVSLLYRSISFDFNSLYGNAFTEGSRPGNEAGMYMGLSVRPATGWVLNGYADVFRSRFIRFRTDAPSAGQDYLLQLSYQPNRSAEAYLRFRHEQKQGNAPNNEDSAFNYLVPLPRTSWRLHFTQTLSPQLSVKARGELMRWNRRAPEGESGFLIFTEVAYKPSFSLGGNVRLQYFETDGFNSRIYAFESDVLYGYSIPAFFDKGFRYYININWDATRKLSFWARAAQTVFQEKTSVSSGLDAIAGNRRTDVRLQVRYRL